MHKPSNAKLLAIDILSRSACLVQVGAAIEQKGRLVGWGWNSQWAGFGIHAECHAIRRTNKRRLRGATIYVASQWRHNGKLTPAKPCPSCERLIRKWDMRVYWRDREGNWNAS